MNTTDAIGQRGHAVCLDWGPVGAGAVAAAVSVIVDVLSFSTSVCVAVERGMDVYPYPWKGPRAEMFAREHDAVLAVGRREAMLADASPAVSLSPASLLDGPPIPRIVLPSPNGSTIAAALSDSGSRIVVGCLRNASAVAQSLAAGLDNGGAAAIIAGERWESDGSLRPALEDHLGAGAILSALARLGHGGGMSPEAAAAAELFDAVRPRLAQYVGGCVSARELDGLGFHADVEVAATLDGSDVVPVLVGGAFTRM